MRLTPEGVEITFLAERRVGFLTWLASNAAGHLHVLMRWHERDATIEDMIEGWSDKEVPTGEPGSRKEKNL